MMELQWSNATDAHACGDGDVKFSEKQRFKEFALLPSGFQGTSRHKLRMAQQLRMHSESPEELDALPKIVEEVKSSTAVNSGTVVRAVTSSSSSKLNVNAAIFTMKPESSVINPTIPKDCESSKSIELKKPTSTASISIQNHVKVPLIKKTPSQPCNILKPRVCFTQPFVKIGFQPPLVYTGNMNAHYHTPLQPPGINLINVNACPPLLAQPIGIDTNFRRNMEKPAVGNIGLPSRVMPVEHVNPQHSVMDKVSQLPDQWRTTPSQLATPRINSSVVAPTNLLVPGKPTLEISKDVDRKNQNDMISWRANSNHVPVPPLTSQKVEEPSSRLLSHKNANGGEWSKVISRPTPSLTPGKGRKINNSVVLVEPLASPTSTIMLGDEARLSPGGSTWHPLKGCMPAALSPNPTSKTIWSNTQSTTSPVSTLNVTVGKPVYSTRTQPSPFHGEIPLSVKQFYNR